MMRNFLFIAMLLCLTLAKAQYVTIPDANFVKYLKARYPKAMKGNQLDTTNQTILNEKLIIVTSDTISNLEGTQYFKKLEYLYCSDNLLTTLPLLPASITTIYCDNNQLTKLPTLPASLTTLHCDNNQLTILPSLPSKLTYLSCYKNLLKTLPSLPTSIIKLYCFDNQLITLPYLPNNLTELYCSSNKIIELPNISNNIKILICSFNQLTKLPILPNTLTKLWCSKNQINQLEIPFDLIDSCEIKAEFNPIYCISKLSNKIKILDLFENKLTCVLNYIPAMDGSLRALPLCDTNVPCIPPANPEKKGYATIPDENFVKFLQLFYPTAMNGNQMDTTNQAILNEKIIFVTDYSIRNLEGIQYFKKLELLDCSRNLLTNLPSLPNSLVQLYCENNQLTTLPYLPTKLEILSCYNNKIKNLPNLPINLSNLDCNNNQIKILPSLPNSLTILDCASNQITILPNIPNGLNKLWCQNNKITNLPNLPTVLKELACYNNPITTIPELPVKLTNFYCGSIQLTSLPILPDSLIEFACVKTNFTYLPKLPTKLEVLVCDSNKLMTLPILPNTLNYLSCNNNKLTQLDIPYDLLDSCEISANNNQIHCISPLSDKIIYLDIKGNFLQCLPNYLPIMESTELQLPICKKNDANNRYNCEPFLGIIEGTSHLDVNKNCTADSIEPLLENIPFLLLDTNKNIVNKTYSLSNNKYQFSADSGKYHVQLDTTNLPFNIVCPKNGDTLISTGKDFKEGIDFFLACKDGFDLGIRSMHTKGFVFPGQIHSLNIAAGEISNWYGAACAKDISGQLQVTITGPIQFLTASQGAKVPSKNGNVFTYDIPDVSKMDFKNDFWLDFQTDTTANLGDKINVSAVITPKIGDFNPSNNELNYEYVVINSHDPNIKEVSPEYFKPGYDDYFTYTIHFQNTGNAPAFNIRLLDTLDTFLDESTFEVMNFSHANRVSLNKNILNVYFKNIMLMDSTTDEKASHGYIQYRIKPKNPVLEGNRIKNTAHIYFDYNTAIVTNTTSSFADKTKRYFEEMSPLNIKVYPNPVYEYLTITENSFRPKETMIKISDINGKVIRNMSAYLDTFHNATIDMTEVEKGIYILEVSNESGTKSERILKQ